MSFSNPQMASRLTAPMPHLAPPPRGSSELERGPVMMPHNEAMQQPLSRGREQGSVFAMSDLGRSLMPGPRTGRGGIFLTSDDHALTKQLEQMHSPDPRHVDVRPLFRLVEDIISRAGQNFESDAMPQRQTMDAGRLTLQGLEEVPDSALIIERLSSEITCKILSGTDAHNTTLAVLNLLSQFSWEAKVVLTLAAFALLIGDFWLLVQIYSSNPLAKSMALMRRLPNVVEHSNAFKKHFEAINNLIRAMLETTRCIIEFGELPTMHISNDEPEVKAALAHFPVAVYWIIRSAVTAATQMTTLSSTGLEYMTATAESWELSNWAHKLQTISNHLRQTLENLYRLIGDKMEVEAYKRIRRIIYETIHIDNMKVLKVLISDSEDVAPLFDGPTKRKVHLDVLRRKNVLLLISGLDITHEELYILEQAYTESKIHAYEIVWIPVVDRSIQWTDAMNVRFETLQASMPWYSVIHPSIISNAVIKFFRDEWHFGGKPILVVLDPQGKVVSPNAIHMMWIWQSEAFPFTTVQEDILWERATWRLELLVDGIDPRILDWIREGKYIFLYGGDDLEWIRKFTTEAKKVAHALRIPLEMVYVGKSHHKDMVRKMSTSIVLEQLSHCWQDESQVWYFWTRIESMIHSKIQLGKIHNHHDNILQEVQRLHSFDKGHGGWVILAQGSTILAHGHGRHALIALEEYELWKEKAVKEGFHAAYPPHLKELHMREFPCHRVDFPSTVRLPQSMLCPDCRRHMQTYNSFICCHEDATAGADHYPPAMPLVPLEK